MAKRRTTCPEGTPHRWILDDPSGGVIGAACMCGATRTFPAFVTDAFNSKSPKSETLTARQRKVLEALS